MTDALIVMAIVLAAALLWRLWGWVDRRPRKAYHYPVKWDGTHATCKCGHHSVTDYNLETHIEEMGKVAK